MPEIEEMRFENKTLHSVDFVHATSGAHTQTIKNFMFQTKMRNKKNAV